MKYFWLYYHESLKDEPWVYGEEKFKSSKHTGLKAAAALLTFGPALLPSTSSSSEPISSSYEYDGIERSVTRLANGGVKLETSYLQGFYLEFTIKYEGKVEKHTYEPAFSQYAVGYRPIAGDAWLDFIDSTDSVSVYSGDINSEGKPHGSGIFVQGGDATLFAVDQTKLMEAGIDCAYHGNWKDGKPDGKGIYYELQEGKKITIECVWRDGELIESSERVERFDLGFDYTGDRDDGEPHGQGEAIYPDGSCYNGQWFRGQRQGYGKLMSKTNTLVYEGEWFADKMSGFGMLIRGDDTYKGVMQAGKPSGYGVVSSKSPFQMHGVYVGDILTRRGNVLTSSSANSAWFIEYHDASGRRTDYRFEVDDSITLTPAARLTWIRQVIGLSMVLKFYDASTHAEFIRMLTKSQPLTMDEFDRVTTAGTGDNPLLMLRLLSLACKIAVEIGKPGMSLGIRPDAFKRDTATMLRAYESARGQKHSSVTRTTAIDFAGKAEELATTYKELTQTKTDTALLSEIGHALEQVVETVGRTVERSSAAADTAPSRLERVTTTQLLLLSAATTFRYPELGTQLASAHEAAEKLLTSSSVISELGDGIDKVTGSLISEELVPELAEGLSTLLPLMGPVGIAASAVLPIIRHAQTQKRLKAIQGQIHQLGDMVTAVAKRTDEILAAQHVTDIHVLQNRELMGHGFQSLGRYLSEVQVTVLNGIATVRDDIKAIDTEIKRLGRRVDKIAEESELRAFKELLADMRLKLATDEATLLGYIDKLYKAVVITSVSTALTDQEYATADDWRSGSIDRQVRSLVHQARAYWPELSATGLPNPAIWLHAVTGLFSVLQDLQAQSFSDRDGKLQRYIEEITKIGQRYDAMRQHVTTHPQGWFILAEQCRDSYYELMHVFTEQLKRAGFGAETYLPSLARVSADGFSVELQNGFYRCLQSREVESACRRFLSQLALLGKFMALLYPKAMQEVPLLHYLYKLYHAVEATWIGSSRESISEKANQMALVLPTILGKLLISSIDLMIKTSKAHAKQTLKDSISVALEQLGLLKYVYEKYVLIVEAKSKASTPRMPEVADERIISVAPPPRPTAAPVVVAEYTPASGSGSTGESSSPSLAGAAAAVGTFARSAAGWLTDAFSAKTKRAEARSHLDAATGQIELYLFKSALNRLHGYQFIVKKDSGTQITITSNPDTDEAKLTDLVNRFKTSMFSGHPEVRLERASINTLVITGDEQQVSEIFRELQTLTLDVGSDVQVASDHAICKVM